MEENRKGSHGRGHGGRIRQHRVLRCAGGGAPWEGETMRRSQSAVASSSERAPAGPRQAGTAAAGRARAGGAAAAAAADAEVRKRRSGAWALDSTAVQGMRGVGCVRALSLGFEGCSYI